MNIHRHTVVTLLLIAFLCIGNPHAGIIELDRPYQNDSVETIGLSCDTFETLDRLNALSVEYRSFNWTGWKLALAFANPHLTADSLAPQSRVYRDLNPKQSFYNFLIDEIATSFRTKTQFLNIEWQDIPLKTPIDTFDFEDDRYFLAIPDSAIETFRNTGCRFVMLLQQFEPYITVCGSKKLALMYQNVTPEASRMENYTGTLMYYSFSFSYVLYDLLEDKIVQFGKALDEGRAERTTAKDLQSCLEDAVFDIIQVSTFFGDPKWNTHKKNAPPSRRSARRRR